MSRRLKEEAVSERRKRRNRVKGKGTEGKARRRKERGEMEQKTISGMEGKKEEGTGE